MNVRFRGQSGHWHSSGHKAAFAGTTAEPSPQLTHRRAAEHLGDAGAGGAGDAVRQRVGRKEAMRDDFIIGRRRGVLAEFAHDVERHVVAPRRPLVEEHAVQGRRRGQQDIAFLGQLARERREERLAGLHPAAGQVPALHIRMLDQEDAAAAVDHHGARAQGRSARETPVDMHQPPDQRLKRAAQALQRHGSERCQTGPFQD